MTAGTRTAACGSAGGRSGSPPRRSIADGCNKSRYTVGPGRLATEIGRSRRPPRSARRRPLPTPSADAPDGRRRTVSRCVVCGRCAAVSANDASCDEVVRHLPNLRCLSAFLDEDWVQEGARITHLSGAAQIVVDGVLGFAEDICI